jgi:hypothetical protein
VLSVSARSTRARRPVVALTPLGDRRTIYGSVSRYKLDEFLQLFDFPSPSQSAEQRFSTNVPLQRLFFMNSDFMQQHAERSPRRSPTSRRCGAHREGVSTAVRPRADRDEVKAGRAFLQAEALKQYEDRKAEGERRTPEAEEADAAPPATRDPTTARATGGRMMAGVSPARRPPMTTKKKMLPVTASAAT